MTRAWIAIALVAGGCRQLWGLGTPEHEIDAPPPTVDAVADAQACFGTMLDQLFCFPSVPTDDKSFAIAQQINTDTDPTCEPSITRACVIGAATIEIDGTITGIGARPLVFVAVDSLTITGEIDVSSRVTNHQIGAGSNPSGGCTTGDGMLSGGGAGGSFGGRGGNGGNGSEQGGTSGEAITLATLRGGCPGGTGGGVLLGEAGDGGGGVYLYAGSLITIGGTIDASGGGGHGGPIGTSGGSGGGSGGLTVLDAPTIIVDPTALVLASGGGGGEGSSSGQSGSDGFDPIDTNQASGGNGGSNGGRGGRGSGANFLGGENGLSNASISGGGGGGGAGYIQARVPIINGKIQPPVTM